MEEVPAWLIKTACEPFRAARCSRVVPPLRRWAAHPPSLRPAAPARRPPRPPATDGPGAATDGPGDTARRPSASARSRSAPTRATTSRRQPSQADRRLLPGADRHRRQGQHRRPRHVPGPDQLVPAGHAGRRRSRGSPATGCGSSPPRASRTTISDVWATIAQNYTDGLQGRRPPATTASSTSSRSTTTRGSSSTGRASSPRRATRSPKTLAEFTALGDKMQADGLIPMAFGDKDGWPAMGTFDILNMRMNGYDFHIGLMAGKREVDRPEDQGRLRELGGAPPVLPGGRRRPDVAGSRAGA